MVTMVNVIHYIVTYLYECGMDNGMITYGSSDLLPQFFVYHVYSAVGIGMFTLGNSDPFP